MTRASLAVLILAAIGDCSLPLHSNAIFRLRGGDDEKVRVIIDDPRNPQRAEEDTVPGEIHEKDDAPVAGVAAKTGRKLLVRSAIDRMRSNAAKAWEKKDAPVQSLRSKVQELKDRGSWSTKEGPTRLMSRMKDALSDREALFSAVIWHLCSRDRPLTPLSVLSLTLAGSSLGFYSFIYFATVGYGVAVALASLAGLVAYNIMPNNRIPALSNVHTGLTFLWSIRLTVFLVHREFINWPAWHEKTTEVNEKTRPESKAAVWITCGSFYATMVAPCIYRLQAGADASPAKWGPVGMTGVVLQFIGLVLETVSDAQKAGFKATEGNRHSWCNVGLWKYFTHPNYLGEILFWGGVYLGGVGCYTEKDQWTISTLGILFISLVIRVANESLNAQELRRYGLDDEYMEFRNSHSFLGPFRLSRKAGTQIHL